MDTFKIGVLRETKTPPDHRVALPPQQIAKLQKDYPQISVVVQKSPLRCYVDDEYVKAGIEFQEDLSDCDLLIGVKEVDIPALVSDMAYIFFAHVAKEQPYNKDLLQAILSKNIKLMDYEYFTNRKGQRLIAFGRWAGIVGAYNGLRGLGITSDAYSLKPAHECHDRIEMNAQLKNVVLNNAKILVSGGGRVGMGAMETLRELNIREVAPADFLSKEFEEPVICRIDPEHYVARKDGEAFDLHHFFENPTEYKSTALPFLEKADLYIAAHFWDPDSPRMFEIQDLKFGTQDSELPTADCQLPTVIADISCDINGSVPTTTRATTIAEPFYIYNTEANKEEPLNHQRNPFNLRNISNPRNHILMMTVDNLPGELPRDASDEFSEVLIQEIIPRIVNDDPEGVIERATITENGKLTKHFSYLEDYSKGL